MDTPAPIIALCFLGVFSSAGNSNLFKWQVCTFTSPGELQAVRVFVSLYDFTGVKKLMASVVLCNSVASQLLKFTAETLNQFLAQH